MTMEDTNTNQPIVETLTEETKSQGRRGAPHKLSAVQDDVCTLYNSGAGAKAIAAKYGVSVTCVISTLRRCGVTIRSKGRAKIREI
jgi:transposase-like protein